MRNRLSTVSVVLGVLTLGVLLPRPALGQGAMEEPLYQQLGGYTAIEAMVTVFAEKLFVDPDVGPFFKGMGTDTRQSFIQKNTNLLCNVTGGPCKIISRPAKTVHAGLGITETEFNIVVGHLVSSMDEFEVPTELQEKVLAIVGTLKPDIVGQ